MTKFTHLHVHTAYSIKDGVGKISDYIQKVKENGQDALAITEHGNLYSHIEFYEKAKAAGIKPIIGCEFYIVDDHTVKSVVKTAKQKKTAEKEFAENTGEVTTKKRAYHVTILAKNNTGYKNLLKLVSIANEHGFYYKPRIDKDLLSKYSDGLICLSGCLGSELSQSILAEDYELAEKIINEYKSIFGNDYYVEVMNHGDEGEALVALVAPKLAKKYGVRVVVTNDAHYVRKEDSVVQDAILAIRDNVTLDSPDLKKYKSSEFYLKSNEEMDSLFENKEWLENAYEISQECNVEIKYDKVAFPEFVKDKKEKIETLRQRCLDGWNAKLKDRLSKEQIKEYSERVKYELDVINNNGFTDYFLIIQDIVNVAKQNGIPMSPGRGSVGGSLVAYLLNITDEEMDPIKYGLYFERFLNPSRISPPDIDLDFADTRRDEIIQYTREKYGKDNFAKILTFGNYKPRLALRDALKVYGYEQSIQDAVAKSIPEVIPGVSEIDFKSAYEFDPNILELREKYKEAFELAEKMEGNPRQVSTHASAYIISDKPLVEYAPLDFDAKNDEIRIGFDMHSADFVKLLKMDYLGLETLTIVENAKKMIKENHGIDNIVYDYSDQKTWDLISTGDTIGIFQFESEGMRQLLKKAAPRSINELADCNAIFRPGAARFIDDYCAVKHGQKEVEYFHPLMESVLSTTYGQLIYQEQVMSMCQILAGFTLAEADYMRKAIGKKKKEDMDVLKPKFAAGCRKNGIDEELVDKILDWFSEMSRYNFNKSHAVAYSLNAFCSAYIKANYPIEFQTAMFNKKIKEYTEYSIRVQDSTRRGIKVKGPDINLSKDIASIVKSNDKFTKDRIYYGLNQIRGVSSKAIEDVIMERTTGGPFKDFEDFLGRTYKFVDKNSIEGLIHSGAMDTLGVVRKAAIEALDAILGVFKKARKANEDQLALFSEEESKTSINKDLINFNNKPEYSKKEKMNLEKEYTGMLCTVQVMEEFYDRILDDDFSNSIDILNKNNGDFVKIACIINNKRAILDKNKNEMAFYEGQDDYGSIKIVAFSKAYDKYKKKIKEEGSYIIEGRISNGSVSIYRVEALNG